MASLADKFGLALAAYLVGTPAGRLAVRIVASKIGLASAPELNQPTKHQHFHGYEFGGPAGCVGMFFGLPVGIFSLIYAVQQPSLGAAVSNLGAAVSAAFTDFSLSNYLSDSAIAIVLGWFGLQVLLERLLPGEWVDGCPLPGLPPGQTKRLKYKSNGSVAYFTSIALAALGHYAGVIQLDKVFDLYPQIAAVAIAGSALLAVHLYLNSFLKGKLLAEGGISDSAIYNFFMGRELNPRIGTFDLKYFCELRPGLIGWTIINMAMAVKQYKLYGEVSTPMYLVNALQAVYTWHALQSEPAILTTMDITTEGFGFMLSMGDMGWVPFTYSLQALYLVNHNPGMPAWYYAFVAAFGVLAYAAFRGSNLQKDTFRTLYDKQPELFENLESMPTKRGTRLITGGWWGICRKINYTADIAMALSWSLCTGNVILPYFYPAYLFALLTHRALRDDKMCKTKYGADWDEYKRRVPYMIIPGIL